MSTAATGDGPNVKIQTAVMSSPVLNGVVLVGWWRNSEILEQARCEVQSDAGTICLTREMAPWGSCTLQCLKNILQTDHRVHAKTKDCKSLVAEG